MSLDEKVFQLGSFWPHPPKPTDDKDALSGEVAPMESALSGNLSFEDAAAQGLGHITRNYGTEPVEVADGLAQLRSLQATVVANSPHAVPAIVHEECLTGFTAYHATVYPCAVAWGATFDPSLVEEMAAAIGSDMHSVGAHQGLSPLLDVVRDYRWGRVEETCGEDPYVVRTIGTAYVKGLQSAGTLATLKHFVGYPASRSGRNHAPVPMGRRELADIMLPPFEMAVREGGTASVMNSYSDVDGVPAGSDATLLTTILRDQWGFEGTVVSDYWDHLPQPDARCRRRPRRCRAAGPDRRHRRRTAWHELLGPPCPAGTRRQVGREVHRPGGTAGATPEGRTPATAR